MEWIIGILFAGLIVPPEGAATAPAIETVYCDVGYQTRSGRAIRIRPDCPDVENREIMERQVSEQMRSALPVLRDLSIRDMTGRIFFEREEHEDGAYWRIQPGVISRINAYYPLNAYESGISGACRATYDIIEGTPENICIRCRAEDFRGEFIREMRRAIRRSFYVDTGTPFGQTFSVDFPHPQNPSPGFPDVPDCSDNEE
jgi:hypothetical protein